MDWSPVIGQEISPNQFLYCHYCRCNSFSWGFFPGCRYDVTSTKDGTRPNHYHSLLGLWSHLPPECFHGIVQRIEEGILAEQFLQFVTTLLRDVIHDLRNHNAHPLIFQYPIQGSQGFRGRVVHVVNRGGIDTQPAQRRLGVVD